MLAPKGWKWTRLSDVAELATGHTPSRKHPEYWGGEIPWISVKDARPYHGGVIFETAETTNELGIRNSAAVVLPKGTVCLSRTGSIGYAVLLGREMATSQGFVNWICGESLDPKFLRYLFQVERAALERWAEGMAHTTIYFPRVKAFYICLPHVTQQRRIVAQLEALLGNVDSTRKQLERIPVLLKRFRQAVLASACSGRLTADWREENSGIEPASELLSQIQDRRLAAAEGTKEKNQIREAFEPDRLVFTDEKLVFNGIPDTWIACPVGAIGTVVNGSTPSRKHPEFWGGDIPWVSSGEVRNNIISTTRERITKAGYDRSSVRFLTRGTVLLAMIGEGKTRGQTAVLDIEATINQNIAAILLTHGLVRPKFVWRWFQLQYEATRERGGGSGPQALNCQSVRQLPFALPPLAEQQEIIGRVEALFALADQIEARSAKAKAHVGTLAASLLARAFRGELVPTGSRARRS